MSLWTGPLRVSPKNCPRASITMSETLGRETPVKIAVLFGGESMERDVSVASAAQVVRALRARGHEVLAVDAERGVLPPAEEAALLTGRVDRVPPPPAERKSAVPALVSRVDLRDVDLVFLAMQIGRAHV